MKLKLILTGVLLIFWTSTLFSASLTDNYKTGEIELKADPEFGKGVNWQTYFANPGKSFTIGPDGSIYVTDPMKSNVFKFSKDGQFQAKIGHKGKDVLGFFSPTNPSILDNKWLVISDNSLKNKITLVNLEHINDSKYARVIRLKNNAIKTVALKNLKIAYSSYKYIHMGEDKYKRQRSVIIKDIALGKEKTVLSSESIIKCGDSFIREFSMNASDALFDNIHIARTPDGNLIAGITDESTLNIISPEGEKIKTVTLDFEPIKLTDNLKASMINSISSNLNKANKEDAEKFRERLMSYDIFPSGHLPYYRNIAVDSDGNLLVFANIDGEKSNDLKFRVYSMDGSFICTSRIKSDTYSLDRSYKTLSFTDGYVIGYLESKISKNVCELIRVKLTSM